jgi:hypothetical protein
MKRAHFYCLTLLVVILFVGISMVSMAEEPVVLKIEISDVVSNADARQIRRLLEPWADPKDITFSTPVDKHGRKRLFTTVVEVKPRHGVSEYSETHTFDVYDITRQLNDSRFRGRHGNGSARVLKTHATIRGDMFGHPGFARSYIRNVPSWRRWRPETSNIQHAMVTRNQGQNFVFDANPEFDQLRTDAGNSGKPVEVQGIVTGFDGPYPIISVQKHEVGYHLKSKASEKGAETEEKPTYDYLENR